MKATAINTPTKKRVSVSLIFFPYTIQGDGKTLIYIFSMFHDKVKYLSFIMAQEISLHIKKNSDMSSV